MSPPIMVKGGLKQQKSLSRNSDAIKSSNFHHVHTLRPNSTKISLPESGSMTPQSKQDPRKSKMVSTPQSLTGPMSMFSQFRKTLKRNLSLGKKKADKNDRTSNYIPDEY